MAKINKILSALVISFTTYLAGATSASAISLNLSWNSNDNDLLTATYSLTGSFTGTDVNNDGFIRGNKGLNINEFTDFVINFRKDPATPLASYNFNTIKNDLAFNFNYQISGNEILQDGLSTSPVGFFIGNSTNGYFLNSGAGDKLVFFALPENSFSGGGTLEATPVPYEFEMASGVVVFGAWLSRKKVMAKIKSWRSKG